MKKSRHSEEKIIAAVKQMEGGRKTTEVARELGVSARRCTPGSRSPAGCRSATPNGFGNWKKRTAG
jgi:hypothetical protein